MKIKNCNLIISICCLFIISTFAFCNNGGVKQKDFYGSYRVDSLWYSDTSVRTRELVNNYNSVILTLSKNDSFSFTSSDRTMAGTWDLSQDSKSYGLSFSVNGHLIFADFNYNYILFNNSSPSMFDSIFQTVRLVRFETNEVNDD